MDKTGVKRLFKRFMGKAEIFLWIMQAIKFVKHFLQQLHFLKLSKIFTQPDENSQHQL